MRIETKPYGVRTYTPPAKVKQLGWAGSKLKHEARTELIPVSGFIKCPHCITGVAKQMVDGKDLVWVCIMCGWEKPTREPDMKHYGEDKVDYEKRY